jgi:glutamate dehydrogenase (NAD(P)+)
VSDVNGTWGRALDQLDRAGAILQLDSGLHQMLSTPRRSVEVGVPFAGDDGKVITVPGYRVQHNLTRGPGKGGLRFDAAASLEETKALAMWMSWKSALADLPFGGAKGAVRCDVDALSVGERERLTRRYTSEIMPFIGPDQDIMAPDLNTGPREMAWVMDTYSTAHGHRVAASVTGKPVALGGIELRQEATGLGVAHTVATTANYLRLREPVDVAIAGMGSVGRAVAKHLDAMPGFRIVAVSDVTGARCAAAGLPVAEILAQLQDDRAVEDLEIGEPLERDALLTGPCTVLVPAAVGGVIDDRAAKQLRAQVVVEAANGPTTATGDRLLAKREILVVPDILANCGGAVVSYFEWVQNLQAMTWSRDEIIERLFRILDDAWGAVVRCAAQRRVSLRDAAITLAVERIVEAHLARGLYP